MMAVVRSILCRTRCAQEVISKSKFHQTAAFSSVSNSNPGKFPGPCLFFPRDSLPDHIRRDDHDCFCRLNRRRHHLRDRGIFWEKKKTVSTSEKELLLPGDAIFLSSTKGWLAYIHPVTADVYLLSPFCTSPSYAVIRLPSLQSLSPVNGVRIHKPKPNRSELPQDFADKMVRKIILSSPPSTVRQNSDTNSMCDVAVALLCDGTIVFCRLGDSTWTILKQPDFDVVVVDDILFSTERQELFVLNRDKESSNQERLEVWDFHDSSCGPRLEYGFRPSSSSDLLGNLVECYGELLLVKKDFIFDSSPVWKLNFQNYCWEPVNCLEGHQALFVGSSTRHESFSCSATFGGFTYLRKNSIYFSAKDCSENCPSITKGKYYGRFDLKDKTFEMFRSDWDSLYPYPCWLAPDSRLDRNIYGKY